MKALQFFRPIVFLAVVASVSPVLADEPGREFSATAVVNDSHGTRRMPVTFVANRFTTVEQAQNLAGILERAGQGGLDCCPPSKDGTTAS
jgi:hypothetical protein